MADVYQPEFPSGAGAGRAREPEPQPERSMADIVKDIVANIQEIIRSEMRLARVEMSEKAIATGKGAAMLGVGAVVALYALGFLLVMFYNALSLAMPPWVSALILTVVLGVIAGAMLAMGRTRIKNINPKPERTVESVKEDIEWIKNRR